MIYGIYSIRDVKTGFMTPTIEQSDEAAARNFQHAIWNTDGILHSFAADFSLYHLGTFDASTGSISSDPLPVLVIDGSNALLGGARDADKV